MRMAGRPFLAASRIWSTARDSRACRASGKSFDNRGKSGQRSPISGTRAESSASDTGDKVRNAAADTRSSARVTRSITGWYGMARSIS
ncbi:hypothetical protein GALL_439880 [mine drainage metagenome]|uniref:Uncharacterized protein n=1 Tax=mine drainage metagenome TaxID=410659 RepID=A0A1J5Q398_9ZZZZ